MIFKGILFANVFYLLLLIPCSSLSSQISLDFVEINTRDLLKILAEQGDKSIVISEKIAGKITVKLHNVSWREALDSILQMQGLIKHETDKVIVIATLDELNKNEQVLLQQQVFNPRYVSADNLAKLLKPAGVLSNRGKSGADIGSNSLVVADTTDHILAVKKVLQKIDVPLKQVLIEARIVSADEAFARALGLELSGHTGTAIKEAKVRPKAGSLRPGQYNLTIAKLDNNNMLDLQLTALENEGRGKIISKPKLLTVDRRPAYIETGAEIPYQEKTREGNTSVSFKKAVLSLRVTPEVVAKDVVTLRLQLSQDKIGQLTVNGVPTIDTRKIHTQVLVHNNETIVLGGIYEWSRVNQETRVPILGYIPLLKLFFSKKEIKMDRKELLIFVTPRIVS